jgi:hypothetical protein
VAEEYTARWEAAVGSLPNQELEVARGLWNLFIEYGVFTKMDVMKERICWYVSTGYVSKGWQVLNYIAILHGGANN